MYILPRYLLAWSLKHWSTYTLTQHNNVHNKNIRPPIFSVHVYIRRVGQLGNYFLSGNKLLEFGCDQLLMSMTGAGNGVLQTRSLARQRTNFSHPSIHPEPSADAWIQAHYLVDRLNYLPIIWGAPQLLHTRVTVEMSPLPCAEKTCGCLHVPAQTTTIKTGHHYQQHYPCSCKLKLL